VSSSTQDFGSGKSSERVAPPQPISFLVAATSCGQESLGGKKARPAPAIERPAQRDSALPLRPIRAAVHWCGRRPLNADGGDDASVVTDLIAGAHLARSRSEVIVRTQLDQPGMKLDLIAAALQHRTLEIVVKDHARLPGPVLKSMHVDAQEVFHGLIEEELQIQSSRIRQRHHEAGQSSLGPSHHHRPKVSPVDLPLLTGKRLELQKRFAAVWPQTGDGAPQLHHAASIAAVANYLVKARSAQTRCCSSVRRRNSR
jgi:hypothetical protein